MAKYSAYGTTFTVAGAAVVQVSNISGPGLSLDTVDVTSHDSTGGWEEVVGTILRSGEVKLDIVYDPNAATHKNAANGLLAKLIAKTVAACTLVFPSTPAVTWTFNALVTGFEPSASVDGALTASVTLKISGAPTLV